MKLALLVAVLSLSVSARADDDCSPQGSNCTKDLLRPGQYPKKPITHTHTHAHN